MYIYIYIYTHTYVILTNIITIRGHILVCLRARLVLQPQGAREQRQGLDGNPKPKTLNPKPSPRERGSSGRASMG